ncbi:hypothetical protein BJ165DRAFT_1522162 [Panaeolus papilionaceus]|nr:hypothetical protein BJ165DRAFT_1522162 [Panaeolus papilionaceus]
MSRKDTTNESMSHGANAGCLVRTYTYSTIASHQMWPLYVTRVAYFEKRLEKATKHQILSILQDSSRELRLSPLVMTIEQDEKDPAWFNITERLPLFAGLESTTTFQCCLTKVDRKTEQGATNDVRAGLGTTMKCEWRVEERDSVQGASPNKELWLSERVEVEGLFFLMPYIYQTMTKAQQSIIDIIESRALA